jgi:SAM-dependent methyltransferase
MILGFRATCLLYVAAELGLADHLRDGDRSSAELAAATATDADALRRLLRGLAQLGVVRQLDGDRFGLTPLGQRLRSDVPDSQRPLARLFGHDAFWRAWGDLLHSVRTGQTAFEHVFGRPLFDYIGAQPDFVPIFNAGMAGSSPAVTAALVAAYDFDRFGTIVDVGSGTGSLLTAILQAAPRPRGILFDLPHSGDRAREAIERAGLGERCRFVGGDFFAGVPAGGDAYALKLILHDWDDERALAVLRQCRRAMPPAATLLVMEHVLPPSDQPALDAVMMDINMLILVGGRERSAAEYGHLFEQAGFRLDRVIPTASPLSIVEAAPV